MYTFLKAQAYRIFYLLVLVVNIIVVFGWKGLSSRIRLCHRKTIEAIADAGLVVTVLVLMDLATANVCA